MRKRLLATLLSLVMVVSLVPVSALAAEGDEPGGDPAPVCTCEASCTEEAVDESCPVCAEDFALCTYEEAPADGDENDETDAVTDPAVAEVPTVEEVPTEGGDTPAANPVPEEPELTPEEQLAELIAALPAPEAIDPLNEAQVEAVNGQIAEIYAFADTNGLDVAYNETVNAVIDALYPKELLDETTVAATSGNCGAPAEGSSEYSDNVTWSYADGVLTISGSEAMADFIFTAEEDTRPWKEYASSITKVAINEGITSIGDNAFRNLTVLTETNIPASITDLGDHLYRGDSSLTTVNWAAGFSAPTITDTDSNAATYTGIYVPTSMFDGCTSLGSGQELSAWLPESFKGIGCAAFRGTQFSVDFDSWNSLEYIGAYAFSQMPNLNSFTLSDTIQIGLRGDASNAFNSSGLKKLTVQTESIPKLFIVGCTSLATVLLEDGVTSIGDSAFLGTAITEIDIPASVTEVGNWAFANCTSLKKVTLHGQTTLIRTVFPGANALEELVIADGAEITCTDFPFRGSGNYAGVTSLKKVEILGTSSSDAFWNSFSGNTGLTDVTVSGQNAEEVSAKRFPNMVNLTIQGGDASFKGYRMDNNTLEQVIVDVNNWSSESASFRYAKGLQIFRMKASSAALDNRMFNECPALIAIDFTQCDSITYSAGCFSNGITANTSNQPMSSSAIIYVKDDSANPKTSGVATGLSNSHGIVAVTNGGTFAENAVFTSGTLTEPIKDGCKFEGWYTDSGFSGQPVPSATAGQTYYAKWTVCTYAANPNTATITETLPDNTITTATLNKPENLIYDGRPKEAKVTVNGDWHGGTNITYKDSNDNVLTSAPVEAGTYSATLTVGGGSGANVTVNFTIAKAESSVTGKNVSCTYGDTIELTVKTGMKQTYGLRAAALNTVEITWENVILGSAAVQKDGTATLEYNTTTGPLPIGISTVTATYGGSDNLNGNEITFTVTIHKANQEISFTDGNVANKHINVTDFTNIATLTKGDGSISYTSSDEKVATVDDSGKVTIVGAGTTTITATAAGTDCYNEATATCTLTVSNHTWDGGVVTKAPTYSEAGVRTYTCTTCSETRTEEIAKLTRPSSGGSSSGGSSGGSSSGSVTPTYTVSTPSAKNGTVTVSPRNASRGTTVTVTVKPNSGYELDDLAVTDKNGDAVKLTRKSDTQYTFTMPASRVTVEAAFAEIVAEPDVSFIDVPANAYYADAVAWAVENGVTNGTSAATFSPDVTCTRAQTVTFLWRAAGSPAPRSSVNPFTDVQPGAYYYEAVLWAVENGITKGTSDTTFSPDDTVTRGQTVTFQHRAAGSPAASGGTFADVAADAYYAPAVQWAVANGITNGTSSTTFSPDEPCTRGQIVTFLYRDMA